ncbi:MAG: maltose alpha-D-glucosyltransferase [Chitinivibrionales bacterium]|nr:maltose alpha-D-glucosyltransferase [Chitinivibrionales bacterium]
MSDIRESDGDPLWYKDAIIYQLHVKSFFDGNNDGIGDFEGLTQKIGYLESLGVNAVWLLPFYPSPLRDDGYDIEDYYGINPNYGTMADFKAFLDEAHSRNIRVITELVLNHTSDQHEWFQKSRRAEPGSAWRDFYVWNDTRDLYREARIIFKDFETSNWSWDAVANSYYWHRFYSHQPDLNYENPNVHRAMYKAIDFWFGMGVDGMRLDAVPYLYEQDGTNCENLPQTFEFLKNLRSHIEERFHDRMLLAEANQWPEDAVAYFGSGDRCHMAFHFPLMPRMFMALQMEDRFPIIDILEQTPPIPASAQWAIFLRNHDELTLEMVSDEERDFMYRSYARDLTARINLGIRRRLAPLVQNSRRRIELLNIMLFSLPGTPVIYYGDEIGMGDNHFLGDRNGVRTPMQWSSNHNAGFSNVNPQRLFLPVIIDPEYHYQSVNVENEERNPYSLLWWMRRTIAMQRSCRAFLRGGMEIVKSDNASVLSFVRKSDDEVILIVINLSRFSQPVAMELAPYTGATPVDLFSQNRFPRICGAPYQMTLSFHDYFWLHLKPDYHADPRTESYVLPEFSGSRRWYDIFEGNSEKRIATDILPEYLQQRTTAGCRPKPIQETVIIDRILLKQTGFHGLILLIKVRYIDRVEDIVLLPLTMENGEKTNSIIGEDKGLIFGLMKGAVTGLIYDCTFHPLFLEIMFDLIRNRRGIAGRLGKLFGESQLRRGDDLPHFTPSCKLVKAGKRNTCVAFGERVFFKFYRRLEDGVHPEIELFRNISLRTSEIVSPFIGNLTYRAPNSLSCNIGLCIGYFHHSKTLWNAALDTATQFFEEVLAGAISLSDTSLFQQEKPAVAPVCPALIPPIGVLFEKKIRILGQLTAQMHTVLATVEDEDFNVEPFTVLYQRSLYQSFRGLTHQVFALLEKHVNVLPESNAKELRLLLPCEKDIVALFSIILKVELTAVRMRIHGDFHLGQIMIMDDKCRIGDFEGLSTVPISQRRIKRSPLQDIASMVHSLRCAAYFSQHHCLQILEKERISLFPAVRHWSGVMESAFIQSYLETMKETNLTATSLDEVALLLRLYLIVSALQDIEKTLSSDPLYLPIALTSLRHYIEEYSSALTEHDGKTRSGESTVL